MTIGKTFATGALALILCGMTAGLSACGAGEGDSCSSQGDCSDQNLICQPITGRAGDYCCPAPPSASTKDGCHAVLSSK